MLKKIVIGLLLTTVIGGGGAAIAYQSINQEADPIASAPEPVMQQRGNGVGQQGEQQLGEPVIAAEGSLGEPWQETGNITEIDDFGFQFALQNGESVYIELGPPDYWQNQGVELQVGQSLFVDGTINEGMIHAAQVMLDDGQTLQLRTETGQPMWSGGVENGQGQNAGSADGEHIPEPQAQVDEWIPIEGTLMSFQGGSMTMATAEGELITFQTGQPRFFAEQNVTFQVGDEIIVIGFYENEQFMAGDITQVASGLRVMLRDPNGRPLWAGPGNGNGKGRGNAGGA
ncbi:MAG: hypothetical protein H8D34_34645 [Chloroflexi bacterium]|nr:hypothetical protein [Chloroflexota bacterium]